MGIDTTTAADHPTTNSLAGLPDDLLSNPPAYYSLGQTPAPMVDPLGIDDWGIFVIRARCVGMSQSERTDGEMCHGRKLQVQWCIKQGDPEPPAEDEEQPAMFDEDGQIPEDEDQEPGIERPVDRPGFSDADPS